MMPSIILKSDDAHPSMHPERRGAAGVPQVGGTAPADLAARRDGEADDSQRRGLDGLVESVSFSTGTEKIELL